MVLVSGLLLGTDISVAKAVAVAVLLPLILLGLWVVAALATNPVDIRYLRAYTRETVHYGDSEICGGQEGSDGGTDGRPELVFTLIDDNDDGSPVYKVYSAGELLICRSQRSGAVALYSQLVDGRIICTDRQLSVPHQELILNMVRTKDPEQRLQSHQALVGHDQVRRLGVRPCPDPLIVLRHIYLEREGYCSLGWLSCLLDIDGDTSPLRLTIDVDPAELLELSELPIAEHRPHVRRLHLEYRQGLVLSPPSPISNQEEPAAGSVQQFEYSQPA
ncbi:MAG: hypothetical protein GY724_11370 [Actinomycetia bacterium]|nr:hypothetical protein [Actinomycetes bacterium]